MSTRRTIFGQRTGLVLLLPLIFSAFHLHAAPFDESIRAPQALKQADIKLRTKEYFAAHAHMRSADKNTVGAQIRGRASYEKWSTFNWQVQRTLDERKPIGDLSEFGLTKKDDGSYVVRLKEYPQWAPLDSLLTVLTNPDVLESYAVELKARGFRDRDIELLRDYVAKNNFERTAFAANKPLIESFAVRVQARDRAKMPVDREQVMAYVYQRTRNWEEARRTWAVGLLNSLDKQRQRILASYFEEMDVSQVFSPAVSSLDELIKQTVDPLISGAYVQAVRQKELEVQR